LDGSAGSRVSSGSRSGGRQRGEERGPQRANLEPPERVPDGVLQDALEQRRQFLGGAGAVALRQLEHAVLHDVQRAVPVAQGEQRLLERAALDIREEGGQFVGGGQLAGSAGAAALPRSPARY
jgi:hypothetical protein